MIKIPSKVKKMILDQQMIVVASVDKNGISNISPRTTFTILDDVIYWIELFRHKSFVNFQDNDWVSVATFDKENLEGFQLKGRVAILLRITDKLTRLHKKRILEQVGNKTPNIVSFKPVVVYSSSPVEASDIPLVVDAEPEFGPLVGGSDAKSNFGFEISGVY
jgi:predicted pyridoxine 5'-phosphate oxidase superfamily flavin-nucleotide-binding protein